MAQVIPYQFTHVERSAGRLVVEVVENKETVDDGRRKIVSKIPKSSDKKRRDPRRQKELVYRDQLGIERAEERRRIRDG